MSSLKSALSYHFIPSLLLFIADRLSFDRASDLYMKGIQNAKERDATDWAELFASVDSRFGVPEVKTVAGSALSMICATWEGEDGS